MIDGAFGSSEDLVAATGVDGYFGAGGESTLDFQASMPLIWPQKPVLFQTDDQYYEGGGTNGWLNSKTRFVMLAAVPTDSAKASSTPSTAATAATAPLARRAIVPTRSAQIPNIRTSMPRHP